MSHHRPLGLLAAAIVLAVAVPRTSIAEGKATAPTCVKVSTSAPFDGVGYSHIVHIENHCASVASCSVSTDVNPSPTQVRIPAGDSTDVNTWRGSPARVFVPNVTCSLEG